MKQKIKSQRGATGTDVLVALGIILIAITVVSTLYVNTVIVSRAVVRASGATRMATNIVENINSMFYRNFVTELNRVQTDSSANDNLSVESIAEGKNKYILTGNNGVSVFNTKIPKGYRAEILVEDIFSDSNPHFDIAKSVSITIIYKVSGNEKNVSLSLNKQLEMCNSVNEPDFSTIPLNEGQSYLPIKDSTVKIANSTKPDSGWYDYSNRMWARVLVGDTSKINLITNDNINNYINKNGVFVYYWIPRFAGEEALYKTTNYPINSKEIEANGSKLSIFTPGESTVSTVNSIFDSKTGIWVIQSELNTNSVSSEFLDTKFGPNAL